MQNIGIKCKSVAHGQQIKKYFKDLDYDVGLWNFNITGGHYYIQKNKVFFSYDVKHLNMNLVELGEMSKKK